MIDAMTHPVNKIATVISLSHVCFQPAQRHIKAVNNLCVCHAATGSLTPLMASRSERNSGWT